VTGPLGASREEAEVLVAEVADALVAALEGNLIGVILHGSLATGEYLSGKSDVDLLGIARAPMEGDDREAFAALAEAVAAHAGSRVDLRVVLERVAKAPGSTPMVEAYAEIRPEAGPAGGQAGFAMREPDLVVEFSICRAQGVRLFGPPARCLIGEVPPSLVLAVSDAQLARWQEIGDDPAHAELTVLTSCRMWQFAEEGVHATKRQAGEWVVQRDPSLDVVRQALAKRLGDREVVIDPGGVQHLLRVVRSQMADPRVRGTALGTRPHPTGTQREEGEQ
jgi:hypothetical protein